MIPDFVELMQWVKAQPATMSWPVRNPYACPVAAYIKATGVEWVVVWHDAIETRAGFLQLQPRHNIRRLIMRIDRRTGGEIDQALVLALGREILRIREPVYSTAAAERAAFIEARAPIRAKQQQEWGW